MNIRVITPTQREQFARHISFKAQISANAKMLAARRNGEKEAKQLTAESFPAETDPPPLIGLPDSYFARENIEKFPLTSEIVRAVAEHFDVRARDITSERRSGNICLFRQMAYWLCRELTPFSFPKIGRAFRKDHSAILYGVNKIEVLRAHNAQVASHLTALTAKIMERVNARAA